MFSEESKTYPKVKFKWKPLDMKAIRKLRRYVYLALRQSVYPSSTLCIVLLLTQPPWCRLYASVNRVNIASDNGLSPIPRQAII